MNWLYQRKLTSYWIILDSELHKTASDNTQFYWKISIWMFINQLLQLSWEKLEIFYLHDLFEYDHLVYLFCLLVKDCKYQFNCSVVSSNVK